jgi:protein-S-isoprenylcysteine O-methyltransferase Ste14
VTPPYWWQLRLLLVVAGPCLLPLIVHLLTHPRLLRRRLRSGPLAESEPRQRILVFLLQLSFLSLGALSALDHDRSWSHVPLLVAGGLLLLWLVFRANPYAAATIIVERQQPVIANGPYAIVRHPLYSALLLIFLGLPPALGSWWGLVVVPALLTILILRLEDEEHYLADRLPGYRDYLDRVSCRLIPYGW